MSASLLARDVTHRFSGGIALNHVNLELCGGEIHALVGENGAGKSTLVKLLSAAMRLQEGAIEIDGHPLVFRVPRDAQRHGIAVVHQDYHLFPQLSVADNIFAGRSDIPTKAFLIRRRHMNERAQRILERCGARIDPSRRVSDLDAAERKLVEIARALAAHVRYLILDEPTSALERRQTDRLIELMRRLRDQGVGLVFVTHRLEEVLQVADRCTVLRNGERVGVLVRDRDMTADELILRILGRKQSTLERPQAASTGDALLRVRDVRLHSGARPIAFGVERGTILGVVGLIGSGASTVLRRLGGAVARPSADIAVNGQPVSIRSVRDALAAGIAYVPEDRKSTAMFPELTMATNLTMGSLRQVSRWGVLRKREQLALADRYRRSLDIRCHSPQQAAKTLSGGNQQKVIIGRWLASAMRVLLMEEPTQGVDIGARVEIHRQLRDFADAGNAVIFLSSDLDEVQELADRIAVFLHGEIVDMVDNRGTRPDKDYLVARASGLVAETAAGAGR